MTEAVLCPTTIPTTALIPAPLTEILWRIRDWLLLSMGIVLLLVLRPYLEPGIPVTGGLGAARSVAT